MSYKFVKKIEIHSHMVTKENNDSWPQKQQNESLNVWELYTSNGENTLSALKAPYIKPINDLTWASDEILWIIIWKEKRPYNR